MSRKCQKCDFKFFTKWETRNSTIGLAAKFPLQLLFETIESVNSDSFGVLGQSFLDAVVASKPRNPSVQDNTKFPGAWLMLYPWWDKTGVTLHDVSLNLQSIKVRSKCAKNDRLNHCYCSCIFECFSKTLLEQNNNMMRVLGLRAKNSAGQLQRSVSSQCDESSNSRTSFAVSKIWPEIFIASPNT